MTDGALPLVGAGCSGGVITTRGTDALVLRSEASTS